MIASFSIVPLDAGEELKEKIADIVPLIERSGLNYVLGAMQTTIEGDSMSVMDLIMKCHQHMRTTSRRVLTHITIDDREVAVDRLRGKVRDVETLLGRSVSHE
jgi:uncharacterized protein (TIGR00106 family)